MAKDLINIVLTIAMQQHFWNIKSWKGQHSRSPFYPSFL